MPGYVIEITVAGPRSSAVIRPGGAVNLGANHSKQIYILLLMKTSFFIITPESYSVQAAPCHRWRLYFWKKPRNYLPEIAIIWIDW